MNSLLPDAPRATTYASPLMVRRRERMLSEAWKLIAERGVESFTIRELCQRAGVSQGTFHNAFGTKENIVGLAVVEYASTVVSGNFVNASDTLEGRLERLTRVNTSILPNKRYISAVMQVFWSDTMSPNMRKTIGDVTKFGFMPFLHKLQNRQSLLPSINIDQLAETLMLSYYGLLTCWTSGSLPDEELARRVVADMLLVLAGATRGAALREVREWQQQVAADGPRWRELRRLASGNDVPVDVAEASGPRSRAVRSG